MSNELKVYFEAIGFKEDPDRLTEFLGVKPDRVTRKGESSERYNLVHKVNRWEVKAKNDEVLELDKKINEVLDLVPLADRLHDKFDGVELYILAAVYMVDRSHILSVELPTIKRLAQLNCSLDIDQYILPAEE